MMGLQPSKEQLYAVLRKKASCFVHVYRGNEALWLTDFPLRYRGEDMDRILAELTHAGYCITPDTNGCWLVDFHPDVYRTLFVACEILPYYRFPSKAAALITLLLAHPADLAEEPMEDLRMIYKSLINSNRQQAVWDCLLTRTAARIRMGQPVAHHGAFYMMRRLHGSD